MRWPAIEPVLSSTMATSILLDERVTSVLVCRVIVGARYTPARRGVTVATAEAVTFVPVRVKVTLEMRPELLGATPCRMVGVGSSAVKAASPTASIPSLVVAAERAAMRAAESSASCIDWRAMEAREKSTAKNDSTATTGNARPNMIATPPRSLRARRRAVRASRAISER